MSAPLPSTMSVYKYPAVSGTVVDALRRLVSKNPSFARSNIDCMAFTVFILGGHLALWFEIFHVLPFYHTEYTPIVIVHHIAAMFVYINTYGNLYCVVNANASGSYLDICSSRQSSWHFCNQCQSYAPPRCHHCIVCATCVLKRDHHCWFAGCCIGHHNYRHYFSMVFSVCLGAIYANFFHFSFLSHHMGGFGIKMVFSCMLPQVAGVFGFLSLYQFFICLMAFVALLCLFLFSWLLGIQMIMLYYGQTEYERHKGQKTYDLGAKQNLEASLGHRWYLTVLSPWIPSCLAGDGMNFTVKNSEAKCE